MIDAIIQILDPNGLYLVNVATDPVQLEWLVRGSLFVVVVFVVCLLWSIHAIFKRVIR